jgi:hypothetical protein
MNVFIMWNMQHIYSNLHPYSLYAGLTTAKQQQTYLTILCEKGADRRQYITYIN